MTIEKATELLKKYDKLLTENIDKRDKLADKYDDKINENIELKKENLRLKKELAQYRHIPCRFKYGESNEK